MSAKEIRIRILHAMIPTFPTCPPQIPLIIMLQDSQKATIFHDACEFVLLFSQTQ